MKIKELFILLLIAFSYNIYSEEYRLKKIDLDSQYELDEKILSNYGNLWISYKDTSSSYSILSKGQHTIESIEFYYKKCNDLIFLGKMNTEGIYDRNNILLCSNVLLKDRFSSCQALGLTESSLDDPFFTGQYYLRDGTKVGELDPYAQVSIDFKDNTITVTHVSD